MFLSISSIRFIRRVTKNRFDWKWIHNVCNVNLVSIIIVINLNPVSFYTSPRFCQGRSDVFWLLEVLCVSSQRGSAYQERFLWWVCVCQSKCVSGTDNSLTSSGMSCRVSSFTFDTCSMLFPDAFSKEALIPTCSPRSEFAITLVTSRPQMHLLTWSLIQFYERWCSQKQSKFHFVSCLQLYQQYCSFPYQYFR